MLLNFEYDYRWTMILNLFRNEGISNATAQNICIVANENYVNCWWGCLCVVSGFRFQKSKIKFVSEFKDLILWFWDVEIKIPSDDNINYICIAGPVYAFFNQVEIVNVAVWWSIKSPH